jgi:hypothetical protein
MSGYEDLDMRIPLMLADQKSRRPHISVLDTRASALLTVMRGDLWSANVSRA